MRLRSVDYVNLGGRGFIPFNLDSLPAMQNVRHAGKIFLTGRGFATAASLLFALFYSQDLGITNRSILAFIMTVNALCWVVFTSGTTLTLRKLGADQQIGKFLPSFVPLFLIQIVVVMTVSGLVIQFYSLLKNYITPTYFWCSLFYMFLSGFHLVSMEVLVSLKKFKMVGFLDVVTILLQFTCYFLLKFMTNYSFAINLFFSLSLSYFIVSFYALRAIDREVQRPLPLQNPKIFWKQTHGNHSLGICLGLMDRADRILIGVFLATPILGKYAVTSSLITLIRFAPDAVSKIVIAKHYDVRKFRNLNKIFIVGIPLILVFLVVEFARLLITVFLGSEWLISLTVCLVFGIQELLRGWFQILANRKVSENKSPLVNKVATFLPIGVIVFAPFIVSIFGLVGAPISFCIGYGVALIVLMRNNS